MRSFFQQEPGFCLRLLRGLAAFFFSFRAKFQLYNHINSGYTVRDGEWSVGSSPLGNVELLTLTLSFPSNRKRYQSSTHSNSHQPGFLTLLEGLNEVRGLKNPVAPSRTNNNKCYPYFQKIHTQETVFFTLVKGCNEVFW